MRLEKECSELIRGRQSIRTYSDLPVSITTIQDILSTAVWAPSAHNAQPWRFVILTPGKTRKNLLIAMTDAFNQSMLKDNMSRKVRETKIAISMARFTEAPGLILAAITMQEMNQYTDEFRQGCETILAAHSLGAITQNILLLAYSRGLGACWYCAPLFCSETIRKQLALPREWLPQAFITLGWPKSILVPRKSRKKTEEIYLIK